MRRTRRAIKNTMSDTDNSETNYQKDDVDMKLPYLFDELPQIETERLSKPQVPYEKLVVPTRMRSIYWKYFGFPANEAGSISTKDVIVCILCNTQMIYNRNTSNLKMHLGARHKDVLHKIDEDAAKPQSSTTVIDACDFNFENAADGNFEMVNLEMDPKNLTYIMSSEEIENNDTPNITVILPNNTSVIEYHEPPEGVNSAGKYEIEESLLRFLVLDLASPDVIDGKGFCSLITNSSNRSGIRPTKKKFTEEILPNVSNAFKKQLCESLTSDSVTNVSISIEEWISADNVKCLSFYAYYLRKNETNLLTILLTTVCCTGSEGILFWRDFLDSLFDQWNIDNKNISAVLVAFSDEKLKKALLSKHLIMIPCFLYLMETFCSEYCFNRPDVSRLLDKCRNVVGTVLRDSVKLECTDQDKDDFPVNFDRPGKWLTTLHMLRSLTARKQSLLQHYKTSSSKNPLMDDDWTQLEDILQILKSLEMILLTLVEENSIISLIKPLIWKMSTSQFAAAKSDSILISEMKSLVKSIMTEAYGNVQVDTFLDFSTSLDPRFKSFVHSTHFDYDYEGALVTLLVQLIEDVGPVVEDNRKQKTMSTSKRSRLSGITAIFGGNYETSKEMSIEERAEVEVSHYRNESSALLEENPLEWWQHMTSKCPNLTKLPRKYLCLPVTVISNRFVNLEDYMAFYFKRASLKYNIADALLFLHVNKYMT